MKPLNTGMQVRNHYKKLMGDEAGEVFITLRNEAISAHEEWHVIKELSQHQELLSATDVTFFQIAVRSMWTSLVLDVSRLTDPEKAGGHENASLCTLPTYLCGDNRTVIKNLATSAQTRAEPLREWRNKRFAHLDKKVALYKHLKPLEDIHLIQVELVLNAVDRTLDKFHSFYSDQELRWLPEESEHSVKNLMKYIRPR
jgi:hypothetical protein